MLSNYLKIALRNLLRHKGYTFINVTGLAVGMACCLLILLFVRDEVSYDRFHDNADRIHRIVSDWGNFSIPATNPPFVARFAEDFPEVTMSKMTPNESLVTYETTSFQEEVFYATPTFFDVFSFDLLQGDQSTPLERPYTVILTEATAQKYFGDADPIGQTLRFDNQFDLEVTAVAANPPENAHFQFTILGSLSTLDALFDFSNSTSWGNNGIFTYLLLPDGMTAASLEAQIPDFIERHAGENWNGSEISLQALTDIHLLSHHNMELGTNSDIAYVYIFSIIAGFILLVACINFMNLATARSAERAKEVGVRKVMGAYRRQLVAQFLAESTVLSVTALGLAVALTAFALPAFRELSGKTMGIDVLSDGFTLGAFLLITMLVGIIAGSYPAFVLSGFNPVVVMRGKFRSSKSGTLLRQGLVVFQFATSIFLIVGTVVIYNQLSYLQTANLGFDKEQVLAIPAPDDSIVEQFMPFKNALQQDSRILDVTVSSENLPSELLNGSGFRFEGMNEDDNGFGVRDVSVGHDFFATLGVNMVAGRPFDLNQPTDSAGYVLNATAAQAILDERPDLFSSFDEMLGRNMERWMGTGPLLGITEDFNMSSLHEAVEPIAFAMMPNWYDTFLIRMAPGQIPETMAFVEQTWNSVYGNWPFAYNFADQAFDAQYRSEEQLGSIFTVFSLLAILIACLGLFGLASFTAEQRTKEIGVRKVLGASVGSIVYLLSKEFTRLVVVALVFAIPLSFFAMNAWLDSFAYRIDIAWWVFVLAGVAALFIAWFTVSYQSIKAAIANPIRSLRYE